MFTPVLQSIEGSYRGRLGQGENWEGLRRAASVAHATYLAAYRSEHFEVRFVGSLQEAQTEPPARPMVTFQGGPLITAVEAQQLEPGYWAVTLEWYSRGPLTDHEIFVHVVDGSGQLVAQADGPALGGMLPIWLWQPGDRIRDVRYIEVPADDKRSYTVKAGVYAASGERLQASSANGEVYSDRAATLVTLPP
jgi:hypothetical protein